MKAGVELLEEHFDFELSCGRVRDVISEAVTDVERLVVFTGRYAAWNGLFGSGVAALSGKIGRSRRIFLDPEQPIEALADRSVFVASFFFDAARDEFDDRTTVQRDTHRCLAQAFLAGLLDWDSKQDNRSRWLARPDAVNGLLAEPPWLSGLVENVKNGYGASSNDDHGSMFRAMGYHLGAELLAEQEFGLLNECLQFQLPDLVEHLNDFSFEIAGETHQGYSWIELQTGKGVKGKSEDFLRAQDGVAQAFSYVPADRHERLEQYVLLGVQDIVRDHEIFFSRVLS